MRAFPQDLAVPELLAWLWMKPSSRLREKIQALLKLGVTQKTIATRIGVSETTFSRWYRHEPDSKGRPAKIPIEAADAFEDYLEEFAAFMRETQRAAEPAAVAAGGLQRTGTYAGPPPQAGHPERRVRPDPGQEPGGVGRRQTDPRSS